MAPRIHARFATDTEIRLWDRKVRSNPHGRHRRAAAVAEAERHSGWQARHVVYEGHGTRGHVRSYALVLQKKVPVLGDLWCLPQGPDVHAVQDMNAVIEAHQDLVEREGLKVFAIRMVPETARDEHDQQYLRCLGLQAAAPEERAENAADGERTTEHGAPGAPTPSFDQVLRPTAYLAWNRWMRGSGILPA